MSIRKVVAGLLITAGIAIMAVPFFWRTTGERNTNQLINEFEQTLEEKQDERSDVEKEQTTISKEEEAILKEGGVIGIIDPPFHSKTVTISQQITWNTIRRLNVLQLEYRSVL